jgi:LPXTG-motif cell wall-anchored protein
MTARSKRSRERIAKTGVAALVVAALVFVPALGANAEEVPVEETVITEDIVPEVVEPSAPVEIVIETPAEPEIVEPAPVPVEQAPPVVEPEPEPAPAPEVVVNTVVESTTVDESEETVVEQKVETPQVVEPAPVQEDPTPEFSISNVTPSNGAQLTSPGVISFTYATNVPPEDWFLDEGRLEVVVVNESMESVFIDVTNVPAGAPNGTYSANFSLPNGEYTLFIEGFYAGEECDCAPMVSYYQGSFTIIDDTPDIPISQSGVETVDGVQQLFFRTYDGDPTGWRLYVYGPSGEEIVSGQEIELDVKYTFPVSEPGWYTLGLIHPTRGTIGAGEFLIEEPQEEQPIVAPQPVQTGATIAIPAIDGVEYFDASTGTTLPSGTVTVPSAPASLTVDVRPAPGSTGKVVGGPWTYTYLPVVDPDPGTDPEPGPDPLPGTGDPEPGVLNPIDPKPGTTGEKGHQSGGKKVTSDLDTLPATGGESPVTAFWFAMFALLSGAVIVVTKRLRRA